MLLRSENLVKRYKSRTVVDSVSIRVQQGEIVGLLGPNGAGKTTTFYMTVGLIKPNDGKIFLDDVDITTLPMYKRAQLGIGYLAQEASVFRKLSVEDNIKAVLEMTKLDKYTQIQKMETLLEEFGLQRIRKSRGDYFQEENDVELKSPVHLLLIQSSCYWMNHLPVLILLQWKIFNPLLPG